MSSFTSLGARALAATACVSMTFAPAFAAALPAAPARAALEAPRAWVPADDIAADRRGWGGHRRHHDDGIDAGDVFAGILILGGIAAIASAASSSKDKKADDEYRYPEPDYRGSDYRGADTRGRDWDQSSSRDASRSIDLAVDACTGAAGREGAVADIYGVQRTGNGYQVSGRLENGDEFACTATGDGRIDELTIDGRKVASRDLAAPPAESGDDRYDTAAAPDFEDSSGS